MGNKKNIIIAAVLAMLCVGFGIAKADNSNSLTQVDLKRSSAGDTIDVTFYTTGDNSNTVVTRKGNNRYVVLLPNVSSSSSVAPAIAGVKDLISDVDVKHVDDGIGGYTKVTFETTKPINIKTYTKKAAPLTQAQKDTKNIIARQNSASPTVTTTQKEQTTSEKTVANTTKSTEQKTATKPAVSNTTQNTPTTPVKAATPKLIPIEVPKPKTAAKPKENKVASITTQPKVEPKVQPKVEQKIQTNTQQKPTEQQKSQPNAFVDSSYVPKMKFDENGKRLMDLEPRVSHSSNNAPSDIIIPDSVGDNVALAEDSASIQDTSIADDGTSNKKHFPIWILLAGGSIISLGIIYLIFDAMRNASEKDATRLESFFSLSAKNQAKRRRREYYDIVNNDNLNWQEKYKLYTEKEKQYAPKKQNSDMSYVTDLGASKKAIIMPNKEVDETPKPTPRPKVVDKLAQTIQRPEKSHNDIIREKLQAKISQMEHAFAQTPTLKEPVDVPTGVQSEDSTILHSFSDIKLKSFSKPVTLSETNRSLIEDDREISQNKPLKEGRFVKLKNSPLNVSRRQSASSEVNASDMENKYLSNNGEMKMSKENENYLVSSLDEYLSILDAETPKTTTPVSVVDSLSSIKPVTDTASRGVSNPISRSNAGKSEPYMGGGLIVKSGYNIDSGKGIYLVNMDGVSAIVGRIQGTTFILKKFDRVIDKPLQVRQEDDNVYIVRAGKYKCLVNVSEDRMGTLIEI